MRRPPAVNGLFPHNMEQLDSMLASNMFDGAAVINSLKLILQIAIPGYWSGFDSLLLFTVYRRDFMHCWIVLHMCVCLCSHPPTCQYVASFEEHAPQAGWQTQTGDDSSSERWWHMVTNNFCCGVCTVRAYTQYSIWLLCVCCVHSRNLSNQKNEKGWILAFVSPKHHWRYWPSVFPIITFKSGIIFSDDCFVVLLSSYAANGRICLSLSCMIVNEDSLFKQTVISNHLQ